MNTIFIPKKISVGFQNRSDTYTGKLAYVVYYDEKGVLRKERSWNSWRNDDIEPLVTDNVPTSGFVLNKKVGDYVCDWNHRQAYVRIYDPRDFEFEITVENLLYILENTSSIVGKGLEGEFVYGWNGKDLILIPTSSPDYVEISKFNEKIFKNEYVKSKDLVLGGTYRTKNDEEYIYMGRFDLHGDKARRVEDGKSNGYGYYCNYHYVYDQVNKGKHYWFARKRNTYQGESYYSFLTVRSLGQKFIETVSTECDAEYSQIYEQMESKTDFSPYDSSKDEYVPMTLDEFKEYVDKNNHWNEIKFISMQNGKYVNIKLDYNRNQKIFCTYHRTDGWYNSKQEVKPIGDGSAEYIFNMYHPVHKNEYLENGKFYRKVETLNEY